MIPKKHPSLRGNIVTRGLKKTFKFSQFFFRNPNVKKIQKRSAPNLFSWYSHIETDKARESSQMKYTNEEQPRGKNPADSDQIFMIESDTDKKID